MSTKKNKRSEVRYEGHMAMALIPGVPVVVPCTVAFWIGRFELVECHRLFVQGSQSETALLLGVTWGAE